MGAHRAPIFFVRVVGSIGTKGAVHQLTGRPSHNQFAWACLDICCPISQASERIVSSDKRCLALHSVQTTFTRFPAEKRKTRSLFFIGNHDSPRIPGPPRY